jgi:adenosylcobalamin-dependent ribonucleoside-triphosphate reductase
MMAFVKNGKLNKKKLYRAFELSARLGFRMTLVELEMPAWNQQQKQDRLIGCSMTGYFDMVDATNMSLEEQRKLLKTLKRIVRKTVDAYAKELGVNSSLLATTVKPEGTLSQLPTVSSGIHRSHAPYFIRRVRISAHDPLAKVVMTLGYPVFPETGQTWADANTLVVEFPVKSSAKRTKSEVSAIEQLETYKMFQECYTEHNTSITVTVKAHEWDEVEQWVWDNWDSFVAVSFLPADDAVYPLMPYEEITEEEYLRRKAEMRPFDASLLSYFEKAVSDLDVGTDGCESGICPIR